jgi:hypothetical protein
LELGWGVLEGLPVMIFSLFAHLYSINSAKWWATVNRVAHPTWLDNAIPLHYTNATQLFSQTG